MVVAMRELEIDSLTLSVHAFTIEFRLFANVISTLVGAAIIPTGLLDPTDSTLAN